MQFTLFHLTYEIARRMRLTTPGTATTGSTTTIVDTASRTEPDDFWNGGVAWLLYDANGAAAAPEAEYKTITDFVNSTATVTAGTFTGAVGGGGRQAPGPT